MSSIYTTKTMLAAVKKIYPVSNFFRNRYFVTESKDIFPTTEVLIEYKKGGRKMAPFVIPEVGGILLERKGYYAERYEPAYIAPERTLTIDNLNKKGFGESLYSDITPEARQQEVLGEDLADLSEAIDRREEWMCSELFTKGEIVMLHRVDNKDDSRYEKKLLRFHAGSFENEYIPKAKWNEPGADIYGDLDAAVAMLNESGNPATDLILGARTALPFLENEKIQKLFDIRRMEFGGIKPAVLPDGIGFLGEIVVRGKRLGIYVYDEQYEDSNGNLVSYMPADSFIITAPNMGHFLYGAITQIEQSDGEYHTYRGTKVPKYISNADNNIRKLRVASAPVAVPYDTDSWVYSKVL